jgi:enoyl-CoA hydratase
MDIAAPPSTGPFTVALDDGIAHLRLSRPRAANALDATFWNAFPKALADLERPGTTRALVISGEGKHFCSGMDVSVFSNDAMPGTDTPSGREAFAATARAIQSALTALETLRFPVIAAIGGACVGGGLELAAVCDLRYASEDAYFRIEEINIGMMADIGSLQRLPKLLPEAVIKELAFLGSTLGVARAASLGFVNAVLPSAPEALAAAMDAAERIRSKAPLAIAGTKRMLRFTRDHSVADSLDYVADLQAAIWSTPDILGAIAARAGGPPVTFATLQPRSEDVL